MKRWPSGKPIGWSVGDRTAATMTAYGSRSVPHSFRPPAVQSLQGVEIGPAQLPPPLKDMERGAIVFPEVALQPHDNGVKVSGGAFDPDAVRAALLLFERLDHPSNSMLQVGPEVPEGLEEWSGLQRTRLPISGSIVPDLYTRVLRHSFEALDEREPGRWTLTRSARTIGFPQEMLRPDTGFLIRLIDALPVPDRSVPYDEVLLFRERRSSELQSLRHHLEDLALSVANGGVDGLSATIAFERFQQSLIDHARVSRETNFVKRLMNVEVKFSWNELLSGQTITALGSAGLAASSGAPLYAVASLAFAGLQPAIGIESTLGLKRKMKQFSPFEYVFQAGREL